MDDQHTPAPEEAPAEEEQPALEIDPQQLELFMQRIKSEQNLVLGAGGALAGAIVGAAAWAVVTVLSGAIWGALALGVGFIAGMGNRWLGKGIDTIYGIVGAIAAGLGVAAGNVLTEAVIYAQAKELPILEVIVQFLNPAVAFEALKVGFRPFDLLFYGIAIYFGYKYSFRRITQAELEMLARGEMVGTPSGAGGNIGSDPGQFGPGGYGGT